MRLSSRFARSLLTTTAGLVLRISPPREGSNATHHTSPRSGGLSGLIGDVPGQVFNPFGGFALAFLVGGHRPVAFGQVALQYVRTGEVVQKAADPAPPDYAVQTLVNLVLDGNGELFGHRSPSTRILYVLSPLSRGSGTLTRERVILRRPRRLIKETILLNPTSLLADALGRNLAETYRRIYGDQEPHIASGLDEAARLVIERIASSDALYHNCEHTALVTLCVQDILRGRRLERTVTPIDWGHTILAALNHDIGYVRGVCAADTAEQFVIDTAGNTITPPRGASDAFLAPYHIERGKIMVRERFASVPFIDEERIALAI